MPTVDWLNREIYVPQSDLTSVAPGVYEHDINQFRLALKNLEDDEGMPYPDTHRHNATVTIGGVTLSRVVEIINNYVVTYEPGLYAVNLTGGNTNISDVATVNGVSIRSGNSAGLIQVATGGGSGATPSQLWGFTGAISTAILNQIRSGLLLSSDARLNNLDAPISGVSATIDQQDVRDALTLAPTNGLTPAAESIDARLRFTSDQATIAAINTQGGHIYQSGVSTFEYTFSDANLSINGALAVTHNLNTYPSGITIWSNTGEIIAPDDIDYVTLNSIAIYLANYRPLPGVWRVSITP